MQSPFTKVFHRLLSLYERCVPIPLTNGVRAYKNSASVQRRSISAVPLFLALPTFIALSCYYTITDMLRSSLLSLLISVLYSKGHFIYISCKHPFSLEMPSLKIQYILLSFFIVFPTNLVGYIFSILYYTHL